MDVLTRGLSLLGPKLEQLTRQIDQLGGEISELRAIVSKKADHAETEDLRQHFEHLCGSVAESRKHAVQRDHFEVLSASVREVCAIAAAKAGADKLERLDQQLKAIADAVGKKAEAAQVTQLARELTAASSELTAASSKSDSAVRSELVSLKDTIGDELHSLREAVETRAKAASVAKLREEMSEKAEAQSVGQLNERLRTLTESLAIKAEFAELEHLKKEVDALKVASLQRAEEHQVGLKRASQQLHEALNNTICWQEAEKKFYDVEQQFQKALEQKADDEKVEALTSQLKVLSDVLSPKIRPMSSPKLRATSPRPCSARRTRPQGMAAVMGRAPS